MQTRLDRGDAELSNLALPNCPSLAKTFGCLETQCHYKESCRIATAKASGRLEAKRQKDVCVELEPPKLLCIQAGK